MDNRLDRLDIDCDDAYGTRPAPDMGDYDPSADDAFWDRLHRTDRENAERELAALDAKQEDSFERAKKLQKLIALLRLHEELVNGVKP